jgi:hypothetical protein
MCFAQYSPPAMCYLDFEIYIYKHSDHRVTFNFKKCSYAYILLVTSSVEHCQWCVLSMLLLCVYLCVCVCISLITSPPTVSGRSPSLFRLFIPRL